MLLTLNQKTIIMIFLLTCYHIKLQDCWCSNIEEYSAGGERKVGGMRRESCQRDLQIFDSTGKKAGGCDGDVFSEDIGQYGYTGWCG